MATVKDTGRALDDQDRQGNDRRPTMTDRAPRRGTRSHRTAKQNWTIARDDYGDSDEQLAAVTVIGERRVSGTRRVETPPVITPVVAPILSPLPSCSYTETLKRNLDMTKSEQNSRRAFLTTTGGLMALGMTTSLAGCSGVTGDGGGGDSDGGEISGEVNLGKDAQNSIKVVEHTDIVDSSSGEDHVGVYLELANNGESDVTVNVLAEFFKDGEKTGDDDGQGSERIPTDQNAKLRYGIRGTREDIDRYKVTIEKVY